MADRHQHLNTFEYLKKQQKQLRYLLRRDLSRRPKKHHPWRIFDKAIIVFFIAFVGLVFVDQAPKNFSPEWGFSFSKAHAESLGLNWEVAYEDILKSFNALQTVRISAYWPEIEVAPGNYNWYDVDRQIALAQKYHKKIVLSVGYRLPRWPECHFPEWIENLPEEKRQPAILPLIQQIIKRYSGVAEIKYWQIENEPYLSVFGKCPELNEKLFQSEIDLAKRLDSKPILITDSGELGAWYKAADKADIFGTTLYRKIALPWGSYFKYFFLPPGFYRLKARLLVGSLEKTIISELQAEPWSETKTLKELDDADIKKAFPLDQLQDNLSYARRTGFSEVYLWGAEWWYYMKQKGQLGYWDIIKNLK